MRNGSDPLVLFMELLIASIILLNVQLTQLQVKLPQTQIVYASEPTAPKTGTLKDKVIDEFGEDSPMIGIVKCESRFRQFNNQGKPLMSPTSDVGIMQINQANWKQAKNLGLDIFNSVDDNIKMGKYILKTQGIRAWTCYNQDSS